MKNRISLGLFIGITTASTTLLLLRVSVHRFCLPMFRVKKKRFVRAAISFRRFRCN